MTLHITEAELVRDVRALLESIGQGNEVIIEREDHKPLAVMKRPQPAGRLITDCIAIAKALEEISGHAVRPDADFAKDVIDGIESHREPIRDVWDE